MWFKIQNQQVKISILAKPNAKKTTIVKVDDLELYISLRAKPHQGEANSELISYLAMLLKLPKSSIVIEKGENSRHKRVILPFNDLVQRFLKDPIQFALEKKF